MAGSALEAFRKTITVSFFNSTEKKAKAHLLKVARETNERIIQEQTQRSGLAPDVEAYANRRGNSNLDSVVLPGPIVYLYRYRREIVVKAILALVRASPVDSGAYRDSHTLYVDGVPAKGPVGDLQPGTELMIANTVPYARRLEVGRTKSGRAFVKQVPNRIYETVAEQLRREYANVASVRFAYVALPGGYTAKGALKGTYGADAGGGRIVQRKRRSKRGSIRYPAIIIEGFR